MKTATSVALALLAVMALALPGGVLAESADGEGLDPEQFVNSLHYRSGLVDVPQAKAHFNLDGGFRYLDKADARRVLEEFWGNPPNDSVLGMIVPNHPSLADDDGWAVVVSYVDEGYVSDEDAAKIDYTQLLHEMQQATAEANEERRKAGYGTVELVGWAVPPHYDAASNKLYWAKQLNFDGQQQHVLNYGIRVLGRNGYLSLNAVSGMAELAQVRDGMEKLLPQAEFDQGARYADHNPKTDKIAAYGVATLIGGGLAAKAGLFAKIGLVLAKFWKVLLIGVLFLGGAARKLFGGRDRNGNGTVR